MINNLFLLQSHKFSNENIQAALVCPKCDQVFKKEFPLDLEGQIIDFKCPICNSPSEADLPYKDVLGRDQFEEDIAEVELDNVEEFEEGY